MITTQYLVEVYVPANVFRQHVGTDRYTNAFIIAKSEALISGQKAGFGGDMVEWAVFHTMYKAQECEKRMNKAVASLQEHKPTFTAPWY